MHAITVSHVAREGHIAPLSNPEDRGPVRICRVERFWHY
jgi:hypothetical protein